MRNEVQLITYADRLAGDIRGLTQLLHGPLSGMFGGVHLLPFFTPIDGADAGFDPTDHLQVDARIGEWADVAALGTDIDLVADLIVNHISAESPQFLDWLARGDMSEYAGMFLSMSSVYADGATEVELGKIYRPRPGLPLTRLTLSDGTVRILWTTFTDQQIDLDVTSPVTVQYLQSILRRLADNGVDVVRIDAVGYAVKTPGTSCFMTPETFEFIERVSGWAREVGLQVLVEIHSHHADQADVARRVDWVYDFALPPLLLHALTTGTAARLSEWLRMRPRNSVTVLDTHDGIGVRDVGADPSEPNRPGLLTPDEIDALVERIHTNSSGQSRLATGSAASNVDLYQVNCTFYDALARDDDRYLLARLIQMFVPGVPQVYYVGLLAGGNDMGLVERTGVGRDINRHHYTRDEIGADLERPVVQRLLSLIRFRNSHPAFNGNWHLADVTEATVAMSWESAEATLQLHANLKEASFTVTIDDAAGRREVTDLLDLDSPG